MFRLMVGTFYIHFHPQSVLSSLYILTLAEILQSLCNGIVLTLGLKRGRGRELNVSVTATAVSHD